MGTRGLIGFILNGDLNGSYCQYDMYPSGVGRALQLELAGTDILTESIFAELRPMAARMQTVKASDTPTEEQKKALRHLHENVSTGNDFYAYLRKNHGTLLGVLKTGIMTNDSDFIQDSLFCEWAYIFDFDKETVHILKGFNQHRSAEWKHARAPEEMIRQQLERREEPYYGCSLFWTGTMGEFLALDMKALEESAWETEDAETQ